MNRSQMLKTLTRMSEFRDHQLAQLLPTAPKACFLSQERAALNSAIQEIAARPRQREIAHVLANFLNADDETPAEDLDALEDKLLEWIEAVRAEAGVGSPIAEAS